jgi:hypothetical protein
VTTNSSVVGGRRSAATERRDESTILPVTSSSSFSATGRKLSSSNSNSYIPSTAIGGSRGATAGVNSSSRGGGTTSRAGMVYDPRDDGFMELDPEDTHMPFSISVNYGDSNEVLGHGNGSMKASSNTSRSNMLSRSNNQVVDELLLMSEQFSDFSLIGNNNSSGNMLGTKSSSGKQKSSSSATGNNGGRGGPDEEFSYGILSPVRPKSVNNALVSSTSPANIKSSKISAKGSAKSPVFYNDNSTMSPIALETETLRSKSANNYLSHARERMLHDNSDIERIHIQTTPLPPTKPSNSRPNRPKNVASVGSAWGVEQDPRSIPRAQVNIILLLYCQICRELFVFVSM